MVKRSLPPKWVGPRGAAEHSWLVESLPGRSAKLRGTAELEQRHPRKVRGDRGKGQQMVSGAMLIKWIWESQPSGCSRRNERAVLRHRSGAGGQAPQEAREAVACSARPTEPQARGAGPSGGLAVGARRCQPASGCLWRARLCGTWGVPIFQPRLGTAWACFQDLDRAGVLKRLVTPKLEEVANKEKWRKKY